MIVQSAKEGQPYFVMLQTDHAAMCGQLAEAFGNDTFDTLSPKEAVAYVIANHDQGWVDTDEKVMQNPDTGLPYTLVQTPLEDLVKTSEGSPEYNELFHPYSGLLSSMHTYGLYHGRYGLSDFLFIEKMTEELRPSVENMLKVELERQDRLKSQLRADNSFSEFIEEETLFHNYKLLQFLDTLGLYMQMTHPGGLVETEFMNVPQSVGNDITIKGSQVEAGVISLSPYPFNKEGLEVTTKGRYLEPQEIGTELKPYYEASDIAEQKYKLVAG